MDGRTVAELVDETDELRDGGSALLAFDAPIGLPSGYLAQTGYGSFVEWLDNAEFDRCFRPVVRASDWTIDRPFIRPERGEWTALVHRLGAEVLWRSVDIAAKSESVFKLVGAKQVGRAAQELWRELREVRRKQRLEIWPFDRALPGPGLVLAEIYPRLAYGHQVVKSDSAARSAAVDGVDPRVRLISRPETEDDFDAAMTATVLLVRELDALSVAAESADEFAEGGILLA
jgi:hypothetical protein